MTPIITEHFSADVGQWFYWVSVRGHKWLRGVVGPSVFDCPRQAHAEADIMATALQRAEARTLSRLVNSDKRKIA